MQLPRLVSTKHLLNNAGKFAYYCARDVAKFIFSKLYNIKMGKPHLCSYWGIAKEYEVCGEEFNVKHVYETCKDIFVNLFY